MEATTSLDGNINNVTNQYNNTITPESAEFNHRNVSFIETVYRHTANVCIYASSLIYDLFVSIYDRIVSKIVLNDYLPLDNPKINLFLKQSKRLVDHHKELDYVHVRRRSFVKNGTFTTYATNKITPIAIKYINKHYSKKAEESFRKEVNNLLKVQQDPSFVQIMTAGEIKDYYYISTRAYGVSMQACINNLKQQGKHINTNVALYGMFFSLNHLKSCIQDNIVYKDIQLKNVLIGQEGAKYCDVSDAQYHRKITSSHILQMLETIIENMFDPLLDNTVLKNSYKKIAPPDFSKEEIKAFFNKYFESKLKENPEITETCIQNICNYFTDTDHRFNKTTILLSLDTLASCLDNENLNPSCFITLIDAWINCVKTEYEYKDPILI